LPVAVGPGAAAGALAGGGGAAAGEAGSFALAGRGAGRCGGFGDSVKEATPRSAGHAKHTPPAHLEHYKEISDGG
jgi:hypothetical protein